MRRQLDPELTGHRIVAVHATPQRRFIAVERAAGHQVLGVGRRGKFLVCTLNDHFELIVHLGMTGSLRFDHTDTYARAQFLLDDGRTLIFRDVRRFGRLAVVPAGRYDAIPALANMGPEPLSDQFAVAAFAAELARSSAPVKALLLGQRAVAGVGNIYADEALWRAGVHPGARHLGPRRAQRLHGAIRDVLGEAIEHDGTTFRDYQGLSGASGGNAPFLSAYGRRGLPCLSCSTLLRTLVVAGRTSTYCPRCQRR